MVSIFAGVVACCEHITRKVHCGRTRNVIAVGIVGTSVPRAVFAGFAFRGGNGEMVLPRFVQIPVSPLSIQLLCE